MDPRVSGGGKCVDSERGSASVAGCAGHGRIQLATQVPRWDSCYPGEVPGGGGYTSLVKSCLPCNSVTNFVFERN